MNKMKYKVVLMMIALLAISLTSAYAGNSRRIGTAGAQELLIPVGSRSTAMGGAVLSTVSGVEAMYWNPAGLASLDGTEAMFTHLPYIADIDVNFAGVGTNIEGFGAIGFGAKVVTIGDIEETTEQFPDGTGREFNPTLSVLNVTYARILTANVSFGVTGMYINEDIFEVTASGFAFDVGFVYDPRWRGLTVGLSIKNYGPEMEFTGRGFDQSLDGDRPARPVASTFDLPSSINLGMAYDFLDDGLNLASVSGNFRSNNYYADQWQGAAEYVYNGRYSLRAGYTYSEEEEYLYGASFGAGVMFDISGTLLSLEYSWTETDVFDDNQFFTLKFNF
ncbi:PorV/PorQ family protein [candidate division GN15 bacterium]|nr:PorV/PorQ family protein [candidate division GN15 bacterium]